MKFRNIFVIILLAVCMETAAIDYKPIEIKASSELKFYKGHLAKFAGDGKVNLSQYWCSDFKNKAKLPQWLEFDFGSPKKINQIRLYMHPKMNGILMLDEFRLEYWDKGKWHEITTVHDYIRTYVRSIRTKNPSNKYSIKVPNESPLFRFPAVNTSKVRLYVTKTLGSIVRLHEMTVSFKKSPKKTKDKTETVTESTKGMYCFDFGSDDSAVRPGFTKVTEKTTYKENKKYGWSDTSNIIVCDRTSPNDLKRDFLLSEKPASFKVKLPDGKYYLYIFSGDTLFASPGARGSTSGHSFQVDAGPKQQYTSDIFPVEVKNNELEIKFKAPFLINALVIAPQKYRKKLTLLSTELLFDPDYSSFQVKFSRDIQKTNRVRSQVTAEETKQGYICYIPSIQQRIFPDTAPLKTQVKNTVSVAGTPGEFDAAALCIYAVKAVKDLKVSVSNLKSKSGKIFNKDNIDLQVVKCWAQRSGHKGSAKTWAIIPELLEKNYLQAIEAFNSRQFWLTIAIPQNTAPGKYSGTIRTCAAGLPEKEIKISLQVYPFKLKTPPTTVFAMYPGTSSKTFCIDPRQKEWDLKQLTDMKRHGMNTIVLNLNPKYQLKEIIAKIKYCNLLLDSTDYPKRPIPWYCRNIDLKTVKAVRDFVNENNLREILFYPIDEPFHGTKLKIAQKAYAEIKKAKGIRTYSTVYQNSVDKLGSNLDVRCYAVSGAAKFDAERIRAQCKKDGKDFWWYTNGTREYPAVARFKAGFFFWKTAAQGQLYWAYMNSRGDAMNDFDTTSSDHCAVYFKGQEIIPTIQWECLREGINDFKYIYTLEQAIKAASKTKPAECAKARQLLAKIRKDTIIDLNKYKKRFGSDLALHIRSVWAPEKYDHYRKEIAEQIIRLTK